MLLEQELIGRGAATQADLFDLSAKLLRTLRMLRPHKVVGFDKIRIGAHGDGGYVCLNDFEGLDTALSLGINDNVSWDSDVADRGLTIYQYDHTVDAPRPDDPRMVFHRTMICPEASDNAETLGSLIRRHDKDRDRPNIILKIDIENWEWPVFDAIDPALLARVSQIVGEFHAFEFMDYEEWSSRAERVIRKITDKFALIHVHSNNYAAFSVIANIPVARVMEFSFVNRAMYRVASTDEVFPNELDAPCDPNMPENQLGAFRF